jgi:hypothetical protein
MLVADYHQSIKTEAPAAFDHGRATPDFDYPFFNPVGS